MPYPALADAMDERGQRGHLVTSHNTHVYDGPATSFIKFQESNEGWALPYTTMLSNEPKHEAK